MSNKITAPAVASAQVKFYQKTGGYGFLDARDRIFFHVSAYQKPVVQLDRRLGPVVRFEQTETTREIKPGIWINYISPVHNGKGLITYEWTFRDEFDAAVAEATAYPIHRLMRRFWSIEGPMADSSIRGWVNIRTLCEHQVWIGYDLAQAESFLLRPPQDHSQVQLQRIYEGKWAIVNLFDDKYLSHFGDQRLFSLPVGHKVRSRISA